MQNRVAGPTGLEPATSGVTGRRSNRLNYDPERAMVSHCWWAKEVSNLRPPACKAGALPLSYSPGYGTTRPSFAEATGTQYSLWRPRVKPKCCAQWNRPPSWCARRAVPLYCIGGGGGDRTRVREHVGKCIYARSLRMNIRPFRPPQAGS